MSNFLILAGTTEGRKLVEAVGRHPTKENHFFVCVATEYGKQLLPEEPEHISVLSERLSREQMEAQIRQCNISTMIDATHPYAQEVSQNAKEACQSKNISYVRLLRQEEAIPEDAVVVKDSRQAAAYLMEQEGNVLLTIGSKELAPFTEIPGFKERLYPRILPTPEMVGQAFSLGFDAGHLICMQGPFSYELNMAMLKQTAATWLVTKESGKAGGFAEKAEAAKAAGAKLVVIGRPGEEGGVSLQQAMALCNIQEKEEPSDWFPFFTNIKGKKILIVGGGKIAGRRIKTLLQFSCQLTVVAKEAATWIRQAEGLNLIQRPYEETDLQDMDFVLAATNDPSLNRQIGRACKARQIPVNVAHRKEDCDFYFPGVVKQGHLVVGLTAEGKDHDLAAKGKKAIEKAIRGVKP